MAAASDGVASPKMIEPSAAPISPASGANDVTSAQKMSANGTLRSSGGSLGASFGFSSAMMIV
jgi:hypothetical protein